MSNAVNETVQGAQHREVSGAVPQAVGRRRVVLLFSDLCGSSDLARVMELEEYAAVMTEIRAIWGRAAARHRGLVIRTQGDGAVIVFGHFEFGEDEGRHAVEAAIEIHEDVSALDLPAIPAAHRPLLMHSGIHAGLTLVLEGGIERGLYDLSGEVPNTAAHLEKRAKPGEILATMSALGPYEPFFDAGRCREDHLDPPRAGGRAAAGEETVAGIPEQQVRLVVGRSGLRSRFEASIKRGLMPLVGRDAELRRLEAFLASSGVPRCLTISGEPGIGKTRLMEEVQARHARGDRLFLRGACEHHQSAEVLQPFVQMVRQYFGVSGRAHARELASEGVELVAREAVGTPWFGTIQHVLTYGRLSTVHASGVAPGLAAFFRSIAARRRVVLFVDDIQWADDATLALLSELATGAEGPRMVVSTRPTGHLVTGTSVVALAGLTEEQSAAAVKRWRPNADPFVCGEIHRYSGGIPLFIEELCHSTSVGELAKAIRIANASRNWVSGLAVGRVERLAPDLRAIVRASAVAGLDAPLHLVTAMLGRPLDKRALSELAAKDLLYAVESGQVLRFKHGITRDAVYEGMPLDERRDLHARVLEALLGGGARDEDAEALAHHSRGAARWAQAAQFSERAGDRAQDAFAVDRARIHYERALDALERAGGEGWQERWCLLSNKFGMSCVFDTLPLEGDAGVFEKAVRIAKAVGNPNVVARAHYWLAYILYALGRFRESRAHADLALAAACRSDDARLVDQVEATKGQIHAAMGDKEQAVALIDKAVRAKESRGKPRPGGAPAIGSAYALACKGGLLADAGDFGDAHACFAQAMELLGGTRHPVGNSVRNWIAVALDWQGEWDRARVVATESVHIAQSTRALLLLSAARSSLGYAEWRGEGSAAGLERLDEAMRWMQERRSRFFTSIFNGWLAAASLETGDPVAARSHAVHVLGRARQGERYGDAVACRCLAWLAAQAGDEPKAALWMARSRMAAARRQSRREQALNEWARGQLELRAGRIAPAAGAIEAAMREFDALGMGWHLRRAARQLADRAISQPVLT